MMIVCSWVCVRRCVCVCVCVTHTKPLEVCWFACCLASSALVSVVLSQVPRSKLFDVMGLAPGGGLYEAVEHHVCCDGFSTSTYPVVFLRSFWSQISRAQWTPGAWCLNQRGGLGGCLNRGGFKERKELQ